MGRRRRVAAGASVFKAYTRIVHTSDSVERCDPFSMTVYRQNRQPTCAQTTTHTH